MSSTADYLSPFACDMSAFDESERRRHIDTIHAVFGSAESIRELPDGYAFRLPNDTAVVARAGEFIAGERLCCPFFAFSLQVEPEGGPVWLSLAGREGVKPFIQAEIGEALRDAVARAAGWE